MNKPYLDCQWSSPIVVPSMVEALAKASKTHKYSIRTCSLFFVTCLHVRHARVPTKSSKRGDMAPWRPVL